MDSQIQISEKMLFDQRLCLSDLRIYSSLIKIADGSNHCSISKTEITKLSKIKRVERHTKNLSVCGYIKIIQKEVSGVNTYELPLIVSTTTYQLTERLSYFISEYLKYSEGIHSPNTTRTYASCLRELLAFLGDIPIKSIGIRDIEKFLALKKTVSAYTARRHFISLKSIFSRALIWKVIDENPFIVIKQPKVFETEAAYFSREEMQRLINSIDDEDFRDLVLTAFYTAFRRGEILSLRWQNVDFLNRVIHVRNSELFQTKSRRNRTVGLNGMLFNILYKRRVKNYRNSELVFSNSKGFGFRGDTITKKFKQYVIKAGLKSRLKFHSLRHASISMLLANGTPSAVVQRYAGHQKLSTTEGYIHISPTQLHSVANNLPEIIESNNRLLTPTNNKTSQSMGELEMIERT